MGTAFPASALVNRATKVSGGGEQL
jgi:hypothetical protein